MAEPLSLLEFLQELFTDNALRSDFSADPTGTLDEHGLGELSPDDVYDALVLIEDNQTASFDRDYGTAQNSFQHAPPPPPAHAGGDGHHAAVDYLNTVVANTYTDSSETAPGSSVQRGDFDQNFDIDSTDDGPRTDGDAYDVVPGDDTTTGFGQGDAAPTGFGGDVGIGAGDSFAADHDPTVDDDDRSGHNTHDDVNDSVNGVFDDMITPHAEDTGTAHVDPSTHGSDDDNSTHEHVEF